MMAYNILSNPRTTDLPWELIKDILNRLPVKPLKRFRCVATSWCSLIDSDEFIKSHLNFSASNSHRHLLLHRHGISSINLDMAEDGYNNLVLPDVCGYLNIHGSCNGLVLLLTCPPVLWNPSTREYKVLPEPESIFYCDNAYSFWYDSLKDDYNILKTTKESSNGRKVVVVNIYSLKSNSWTELTDFPSPMNESSCFMYSNEVLHTFNGSISAYNVESKKYYKVTMPPGEFEQISTIKHSMATLGDLGGCLSLTHYKDFYFVIWVMKDYGVEDSWSKLSFIDPFGFTPKDFYFSPLGYSKDGTKLLLHQAHCRLLSYDLREKTEKNRFDVIKHYFTYKLSHNCYYMESLISLKTHESSYKRKKLKDAEDG